MKDWSDLEEKYQDMRLADPKSAQTFKQRMTARFQVCKSCHILDELTLRDDMTPFNTNCL